MIINNGKLATGFLASIVALGLAGCGGGSGGSTGSATVPNSGSASPPPTSTPAPPSTANRAPTISGSPPTTATAGAPYSFQPAASDADGDTLAFIASGLPQWLTINSSTGQLAGTVPADATGTFDGIVVSVSDGKASANLPAFSITLAAPTIGAAELTWTAPTQNEDGTPLTNLAGYKVRYGRAVGSLTQVVDVPASGTTNVRIEGLTGGTWYFTVASYTNTGVESAPTGAVSKTIT